VGKGSRCKRRACDGAWKGEDQALRSSLSKEEDECRYHPGPVSIASNRSISRSFLESLLSRHHSCDPSQASWKVPRATFAANPESSILMNSSLFPDVVRRRTCSSTRSKQRARRTKRKGWIVGWTITRRLTRSWSVVSPKGESRFWGEVVKNGE
jgi:hypothetical protein